MLAASTAAIVTLAVTLVLSPGEIELGVDIGALATMPPRQLRAMSREAQALWQPYGVRLTWVLAAGPGTLPQAGDSLKVVDNANDHRATDERRLGAVLFLEGNVVADKTVVLSINAVGRIAEQTPWASRRVTDWPRGVREELLGRALGRVLAHEIGHYLLLWRSHTADGLMRPQFASDSLVAQARDAFTLSFNLLPRLRARLAQLTAPGSRAADTR